MKGHRAALAVIAIGLPAIAAAERRPMPMMKPELPVACGRDKKTGEMWRAQCDHAAKACLLTPNAELDTSNRPTKPLERARPCDEDGFDQAAMVKRGYGMVNGRADAPYGWTRDERNRVFQVNFDLRRRLYFGAAYTPQKVLENPLESTRTSADFGLLIFDVLSNGQTPTRHRFRFVEGSVHVEKFSAEVTLAHYDISRRWLDPLLRITTFVGTPRRHDLHLNLGMWSEAGGLEVKESEGGHSTIWKHATANITLDLWQSAKLDSFVRLRTGMGIEGQHTDGTGYRSALVPGSALEVDAVLDEDGFHNLRFEFVHDMPRYFIPLQNGQHFAQRMRARVQYEAIVLAINDQPLTLKLAAGGEKRNDIFGVPDQWAFVADAGLRFSLWAPPRAKP